MIILLVILLTITLYQSKYAGFNKVNADYMGREVTTSVKGIFAIVILLSHMRGYITLDSNSDGLYNKIISAIGQLMVAPYFFYSGYGIMESYKKKADYVNNFFKNRVLKTLFHFDLAVLLFLIVESCMGHDYPVVNYIFCWVGWESIGNSNWFVFDILVLYVIVYLTLGYHKRYRTDVVSFVIIVTIITAILWGALKVSGRGGWWYNTLFCFPAGLLFSVLKERINDIMHRKGGYIISLLTMCIMFILCEIFMNGITETIMSVIFCFLLVLITMKIRINNKMLYWLGINCFGIYILQRLPMNILKETGLIDNNLVFAVIVIPSALLMSWAFTKMTDAVDQKIFRKNA